MCMVGWDTTQDSGGDLSMSQDAFSAASEKPAGDKGGLAKKIIPGVEIRVSTL